MVISILRKTLFLDSIFFTQGLIVSPLTSISHAPQLPVKQPEGILKFAFFAVKNQSSPSSAKVIKLFGQRI